MNEKYDYEKVGNVVINFFKEKKISYKDVDEPMIISTIIRKMNELFGDLKVDYLIDVDEDFLPDTISYISEKLKK
jgi:hypothetical protein